MFRGTGAPALPVQLIGPPLGAGMLSIAAVVNAQDGQGTVKEAVRCITGYWVYVNNRLRSNRILIG